MCFNLLATLLGSSYSAGSPSCSCPLPDIVLSVFTFTLAQSFSLPLQVSGISLKIIQRNFLRARELVGVSAMLAFALGQLKELALELL